MARLLALLAVLLIARGAAAQSLLCQVSSGALAFGTINPLKPSPVTSTASLQVTCTTPSARPVPVQLTLGAQGGTLVGRSRHMGSPGAPAYGVYVDAARTLPWGDGGDGTAVFAASGFATQFMPFRRMFTAYGTFPGGQRAARVGSYRDTLTVVLNYNSF
jgi:spore coat protein U-like protein